jgi:hypothetical protein
MRDRKKAPFLVVSGAFLLKMRRKVYIISSLTTLPTASPPVFGHKVETFAQPRFASRSLSGFPKVSKSIPGRCFAFVREALIPACVKIKLIIWLRSRVQLFLVGYPSTHGDLVKINKSGGGNRAKVYEDRFAGGQ